MRSRGAFASLFAVLGILLTAPGAWAATLAVDDDRGDCTTAAYTSIQDAIDDAAPGDTIAVCPGRYAEGNGNANQNGLTIGKSLTIKGAGADLVTISPRRYAGNDGVIADDPQDIRRPSGNIVTAVGTPALPVSVDISGVTIDGNGVAAKAGIVFIDAQGSLRRSRVTDIVTSEAPGAYDMPGGYRSSFLGYGVALVTAAPTRRRSAPARATLTMASMRIDEYNRGRRADRRRRRRRLAGDPVRRRPAQDDLRLADRRAQPVLGRERGRQLPGHAEPARQPRSQAARHGPAVRPGRRPHRRAARAATIRARSSRRTSSRARTARAQHARRTTPNLPLGRRDPARRRRRRATRR